MSANDRILFFLKAPRPGYVKTRLAKTIGPERALEVYSTLASRQLDLLRSEGVTEIHFAPAGAETELRNWLGNECELFPQVDGDLGERLQNAVAGAFARGAERVFCVGGDCPGLSREHVAEARAALEAGNHAVFGPTIDGGYYLLGVDAPSPGLFQNIPWSSSATLQASLDKARARNLQPRCLDTLYDIDELPDLRRAVADGWLPGRLLPEGAAER